MFVFLQGVHLPIEDVLNLGLFNLELKPVQLLSLILILDNFHRLLVIFPHQVFPVLDICYLRKNLLLKYFIVFSPVFLPPLLTFTHHYPFFLFLNDC